MSRQLNDLWDSWPEMLGWLLAAIVPMICFILWYITFVGQIE